MPDPTPPTQNSPVPDLTTPPQNSPVPDPTPPPAPVAPVPDITSPATSTPAAVADCHGVKWYDYEDVIDLDEAPSLQWKFPINMVMLSILNLVFGCPGFMPG